METEAWIDAWGDYCGLRDEFRRLFSSEEAKAVIRKMRDREYDPEVLAFAYYWFTILRSRPRLKPSDLDEGRRRIDKLLRWNRPTQFPERERSLEKTSRRFRGTFRHIPSAERSGDRENLPFPFKERPG
jgi:hypothetical protein